MANLTKPSKQNKTFDILVRRSTETQVPFEPPCQQLYYLKGCFKDVSDPAYNEKRFRSAKTRPIF